MLSLKLIFLLTGLLIDNACAALSSWHQLPKKAIYLQSNSVEGNSIVALPIQDDGSLGNGTLYPTKGKGGNHVDMTTMQPVVPDALLSQSSVAIAGNFLFTTNAMSNSASVFIINQRNATDLRLVSTSTIKDGNFPNTIAASLKHRLVCVATTGFANGVSCANFDSRNGIGNFDLLRPLGLNQSTPPTGPPNTVSQVSFTADEAFLIVTVKADPPTNKPGFVEVYQVEGKQLSRDPVRSFPKETAILFGFTQIPHSNNLIVTDPSIGAAILSFNPQTCDVSTLKVVNITAQRATCWSAISPATGTAFVADGGVNRLVEISVPDGGILSITDLSANADLGLLDIVAAGDFLYALAVGKGTMGPSVTVVEAKTKVMVQHLGLSGLGVTANAQGMAAFV